MVTKVLCVFVCERERRKIRIKKERIFGISKYAFILKNCLLRMLATWRNWFNIIWGIHLFLRFSFHFIYLFCILPFAIVEMFFIWVDDQVYLYWDWGYWHKSEQYCTWKRLVYIAFLRLVHCLFSVTQKNMETNTIWSSVVI